MEFEWQKAKVLVSKLKCDPYEYVSLDERLEKLDNASSPMEDRVDQINNTLVELLENNFFNFKCPTDSNNYKLINNVCYYFERQKMKYNDAQLNCRLRVGQFGGHLFEPFTKEISMEVYKMAKSVLGTSETYWWIGIDSMDSGSSQWRYASDGTPLRFTEYEYGGLSGNYCAMMRSNNGHATYNHCHSTYYSIC